MLEHVASGVNDLGLMTEANVSQLNGHRSAGSVEESRSADFNLTDVGNAKRLVAKFGDKLRYVPGDTYNRGWGWLWFDGKHWAKVSEIFVTSKAKETLLAMKEEGLALQRSSLEPEQEEGQKLGRWATASENGYHLERMVAYARDEVLADKDDFDKDPWLLNALDCTIDLRTGLTHPHNPKDLLTKIAGAAYDKDVSGSRFSQFIDEVFEGEPETAEYVQKLLGLSLTGDTSEKHVWFPTGGGDNGKTLLFEVTGAAMGDYATVGQKEVIVTHEKHYRSKTFGTANLVGYRRVVFAETEAGDRLNWDILKPLTGQDTMSIEEKFKQATTGNMQLKVFIYTNELPRIEAVGDAEWGRIRVIPFKRCFSDKPGCKEADKHLLPKLKEELSAVLRWLVGGCVLWQEYGLSEPKSVSQATKIYQKDEDPFLDFLEAETTTVGVTGSPHPKTRLKDLHIRYHQWYDGHDWEAPFHEASVFGLAFKVHGYEKTTIKGASWIKGIRLLTDEEKREGIPDPNDEAELLAPPTQPPPSDCNDCDPD